MKIGYSKDFDKKVDKLKNKIAKKKLHLLIKKLEDAKTLEEIPNTITIKGSVGLFRITTGDFRLIVERIKNGEIVIILLDYLIRNEKTYRNYN